MQSGKILNQNDVKTILAEYFKVSPEKVIASKYSYIIVNSDEKGEANENNI